MTNIIEDSFVITILPELGRDRSVNIRRFAEAKRFCSGIQTDWVSLFAEEMKHHVNMTQSKLLAILQPIRLLREDVEIES